jgi:phosphate transport system protein
LFVNDGIGSLGRSYMPYRLESELEKIKKHVLTLGAVVEERVHKAVQAIDERDENIARQVIDGDPVIDQMEVDLEEECLKILALHQPVAIDLRFLVAVLKINNDLERIGDLAVNIAERAAFLAVNPKTDIPFDFPTMSEIVKTMLKKSLDSLVKMNDSLAMEVCEMDDQVDLINRQMYQQVKKGVEKSPKRIETFLHLISVSRHLERIADLTTNIAEDVIYMVEGTIIRHKTEDYMEGRDEKASNPDV